MSEEKPSLDAIKQYLRQGQKIQAIKALREESGIGLKEAKDQVDAIQAKMIADGESLPKASGCAGVLILFAAGLGTVGAWMLT
ncbi:ribosomal protein L7/L12 [Bremerella sp. T1]|uniref:ribosomal protein L7/L12 n=1 Tax=Bremerella sp. TYQ1 TaxID=3119568 RepID=UPI001CC8F346|nr:ribosomal protein L7/L12 [Bremerella volcania]UBM38146.1 ribosomal protein L7/L12 [Bremerella volcania]